MPATTVTAASAAGTTSAPVRASAPPLDAAPALSVPPASDGVLALSVPSALSVASGCAGSAGCLLGFCVCAGQVHVVSAMRATIVVAVISLVGFLWDSGVRNSRGGAAGAAGTAHRALDDPARTPRASRARSGVRGSVEGHLGAPVLHDGVTLGLGGGELQAPTVLTILRQPEGHPEAPGFRGFG